jgi:hypothetical protein
MAWNLEMFDFFTLSWDFVHIDFLEMNFEGRVVRVWHSRDMGSSVVKDKNLSDCV